jgi:methyl-accepting chemotaxis protein
MIPFKRKLEMAPKLINDSYSIENVSNRINELLKLLQITEKDFDNVQKIDYLMADYAPKMAKQHYDMIMKIPEIQKILEKNSTFDRYTSAITKYFMELTNPKFSEEYVAYRKKIGRIHSRIGLMDEWYIGSYIRVYENLFPIIIKKFQHSPRLLHDIVLSLIRIITFDTLVVIGSTQEQNDYHLLQNISKVMEFVIRADKMKSLLSSVDSTIDELSSVTSSAAELSASIEQVTENAVKVSESAEQMIIEAKEGQKVIEATLNGFLQMANEFTLTKEKVDSLIDYMASTTQVIDFIKSIAEETNLLALNASIEAARAGEHGKGFAVVADEVRKLAEQTKSSVEQISNTINKIQENSNDVASDVERMSNALHDRVSYARRSIELIDLITNQVNQIGESITNIAAYTEEQSSGTQDIKNRIDSVYQHTESIRHHAEETGLSIYQVSTEVDQLRKNTIQSIPELTPEAMIRIVQTEHALYQWWTYNALLGYQTIDDLDEIRHEECRFGHWYKEMEKSSLQSLPSFKAIEKPHQEFHMLIEKVSQQIKQGHSLDDTDLLSQLNKETNLIISLLKKLQVEVRSM